MKKKIKDKIVTLTSNRRGFIKNTLTASALGVAAASFPHVWMKQGNVYAAKNEIKVGVLFSLTGGLAIIEESLHKATIMAIEEINAAGGVNGMKIKAIEADPASDPATFACKSPYTSVKRQVCDSLWWIYFCKSKSSSTSVREDEKIYIFIQHFMKEESVQKM